MALLAAGGCGEPDPGPPPIKMDAARVEESIKKIDADPNMTPQAKEAAKAGMRAAAASAAAARQSAPPPNPGR